MIEGEWGLCVSVRQTHANVSMNKSSRGWTRRKGGRWMGVVEMAWSYKVHRRVVLETGIFYSGDFFFLIGKEKKQNCDCVSNLCNWFQVESGQPVESVFLLGDWWRGQHSASLPSFPLLWCLGCSGLYNRNCRLISSVVRAAKLLLCGALLQS